MFAKRFIACACCLMLFFVAACATVAGQLEPPELLVPLSNRVDTAIVVMGTVEQVAQYSGIVRVDSRRLHFGNTHLRFGEFHVMSGDRVSEGQLLASLDTLHVEEQLEELVDELSLVLEMHAFENEMIRNEISILRARRDELSAVNADSGALNAITIDIRGKELELSHAQERQELVIGDIEASVRLLTEELENAQLLAPFDGIVTWLAPMSFREFIYPFQTLVSISDEKDIFIEYASVGRPWLSHNLTPVFTATVGDEVYDLRLRVLSAEQSARYLINRMTPPVQFDILDSGHSLVLGVPVLLRHYVSVAEDTLIIPANSVYSVLGERYVYINVNGNKEMRIIETGIRNGAFVQVLSGLEEGDEVFVR